MKTQKEINEEAEQSATDREYKNLQSDAYESTLSQDERDSRRNKQVSEEIAKDIGYSGRG